MGVWHNDGLTFEEKHEQTKEVYEGLLEEEKQVVSKDSEFYLLRLQDLLIKHFEATFPFKSKEPMLRVVWFFGEMDKPRQYHEFAVRGKEVCLLLKPLFGAGII